MALASDGADVRDFIGTLGAISDFATDGLNTYVPDVTKINEDGTFNLFGQGQYATKARILAAIKGHLLYLREHKRDIKLFVLYVAAHGGIDVDGKSYILAADSQPGNRHSLLYYGDVLRLIYAELAEENRNKPAPSILVFLDTCRSAQSPGTHVNKPLDLPRTPRNAAVVLATAPGQYAFHWPSLQRADVEVVKSERWGVNVGVEGSRLALPGKYEVAFASKISAASVAAFAGLKAILNGASREKVALRRAEGTIRSLAFEPGSRPFAVVTANKLRINPSDRRDAILSYGLYENRTWTMGRNGFLSVIRQAMPMITSEIRGYSEIAQDLQVLVGDESENPDFFELIIR